MSLSRSFLKTIYDQFVKINDTPQKIALGFGLGVFLGILPGAGPIASVVLSTFFKLNKIAALTGSLLTNTWLSVVTFLLAAKLGALATHQDWSMVYGQTKGLIKNFHWRDLFNISFLQIAKPLLIGYFIVGLVIGLLSYLLCLFLLKKRNKTELPPLT